MDKIEFLFALEELTEEELPPLIDWAQQRIEQLKQIKQAKVIKEIESLASEIGVGVTIHSLDNARLKPIPKYEDPRTGVTWAGRGRTPIWLKRYVEAGRDIEEFKIALTSINTPTYPKYQNPETGELWIGRGETPLWLQKYLAEGKSIEEFKISEKMGVLYAEQAEHLEEIDTKIEVDWEKRAERGYKELERLKELEKLPLKYQDPETGKTWAGRGRMPNWLKKFIAEGRSILEFQLENYGKEEVLN